MSKQRENITFSSFYTRQVIISIADKQLAGDIQILSLSFILTKIKLLALDSYKNRIAVSFSLWKN